MSENDILSPERLALVKHVQNTSLSAKLKNFGNMTLGELGNSVGGLLFGRKNRLPVIGLPTLAFGPYLGLYLFHNTIVNTLQAPIWLIGIPVFGSLFCAVTWIGFLSEFNLTKGLFLLSGLTSVVLSAMTLSSINNEIGNPRFEGAVREYTLSTMKNHDLKISLDTNVPRYARIDLMRDGKILLETRDSNKEVKGSPTWKFGLHEDFLQICLEEKCLDINNLNGQLSYHGDKVGDILMITDITQRREERETMQGIIDFIRIR